MKIGIYYETFDPFTIYDLELLEQMQNELHLDKQIIVPAYKDYRQKYHKVTDSNQRYKIIQLCLNEATFNYEINDFYFKRKGTSYAFEIINYLSYKYPNDQLYFYVSSNELVLLEKTKEFENIKNKVIFTVYKKDKEIIKNIVKRINGIKTKVIYNGNGRSEFFKGDFGLMNQEQMKYIGQNFIYANEIIHGILSAKRAKHCVAAAQFAAQLAKSVNYDSKKAYYAGLFHDVFKELSDQQFKAVLSMNENWNVEHIEKHEYHQKAGYIFLKYIYPVNDPEIEHAVLVHTTLANELNVLDKIIYIADKICDGRAFSGVQKTREIALENFDLGFKMVVKQAYDFNINKGVIYTPHQEAIMQKWMK